MSQTINLKARPETHNGIEAQPKTVAKLERNALFLLLVLTAIAVPLLATVAVRRPLWFDEIYTVSLSRMSFGQLWKALETTVDQQPPLTYLLIHWSFALFGDNAFAARLQSIFGFWLMSVAIFRFVSLRSSAAWGFLAALVPYATDCIYFGSEARPYGLLMGLSAAALASWQSAAANRHRKVALVCLVAAILLDVASQYYAVLMIVPLLAGEMVRSWKNRRIDWPVLLSASLPFGFVLTFLPFIRASIQIYSKNAWNAPSLKSLYLSYNFILGGNAAVFWSLPVVCLGIYYFLQNRGETDSRSPLPPLHDAVAALALTFLTVPAYLAAVLKTHMLYPRYVLPLAAGCAILFGFALYRMTRGRVVFAYAGALCLICWICLLGTQTVRNLPSPMFGCPAPPTTGETASLPVVIDDSKAFLRCWYYAPEPLKSRIVFVSDPVAAASVNLSNSIQTNLLIAHYALGFPVVKYNDFRAAHQEFLLSQGVDFEAHWVLRKYQSEHARVTVLDKAPWTLLLVSEAPQNAVR